MGGVRLTGCQVMNEQAWLADHSLSLSDHSLVEAHFALRQPDVPEWSEEAPSPIHWQHHRAMLKRAMGVVEAEAHQLRIRSIHFLIISTICLLFIIGCSIFVVVAAGDPSIPTALIQFLFGVCPLIAAISLVGLLLARVVIQQDLQACANVLDEWRMWEQQEEVGQAETGEDATISYKPPPHIAIVVDPPAEQAEDLAKPAPAIVIPPVALPIVN